MRHRYPNVLIQFEDFSSDKAQKILNKYRDEVLCFNDDIQGTGATTLAGVLGGLRAKGEKPTSLGDQRILIAGAGSAGIGVAQVLMQAMMEHGRTEEEAKNCFFIADEKGLLGTDRLSELSPEQAIFARDTDGGLSLNEIVNKHKPTMILGMTAVGGLFTEQLIRDMAKHCERPIIFPLSNPTTKAECSAEQAFEWTDGQCIFASGSPFEPVELKDGRKFYPTQCNIQSDWGLRFVELNLSLIECYMLQRRHWQTTSQRTNLQLERFFLILQRLEMFQRRLLLQ